MKCIKMLVCFAIVFALLTLPSFAEKRATINFMTIYKKDIIIDGKFNDWDRIRRYSFDTDTTSGRRLNTNPTMKIAWNGKDTLYIYATLRSSRRIMSCPNSTTTNWWDYDVFELFMQTKVPSDIKSNQATAFHYAVSDRFLITSSTYNGICSLKTDSLVKNSKYNPYTKSFSFEMAVPLKGKFLKKIQAGDSIFLKFGTEMNSSSEFAILGYPKFNVNAFWSPYNYIECTFKK